MALGDFLYRCPFCGAEPLEGKGDKASCSGCARQYERGEEGTRIFVHEGDGRKSGIPARRLAERLDELESASGPSREGRGYLLESAAVARFATGEEPVRFRGALLGYVEKMGPERAGTLGLGARTLKFRERDGTVHQWDLLDLRALQTASSTVQVSSVEGGVVTFSFAGDSPRRWERLLKVQLRKLWREEDRGEIFEFQPRIRAR